MPTYNFICDDCGIKFEKYLSFNEQAGHLICPNGHAHVRRLYSPPTIVFKGSGFYVTDNKPKGKSKSN